MAAFRDFAAYAAELTELHKRFKREARLREGQEKAPELRHETLPEEYGDISQEGPNSGIIEEVNYIIKEDMSRGEEKQESKVDFKRRCDAESYSIYEGSAVTCGYRCIQGGFAQANARQIQEELKSLGIAADIIDGGVLWNFDGISSTKDVPEAVTVESKRIFINNDVALDPHNVAGHEAFHMWRGGAERTAYIEAIENNLLFTSEAFQTYQATIAESYLGGEADLSDPEQVRQLLEEIFAYISGDLHEGGHDAELAPMFRDFDTVKAAWETLVEGKKSAATLSEDEKGALLDYKGSWSYQINSVLRDSGPLDQEASRKVEALDQAIQKLPVYRGTVYRRMTFDMAGEVALEAFLAEHEPGETIRYPAFTSASTKSDGYPIDGKLTVTLIIQSESGRNLDGHGNNIEQEIVFKRESRFFIERIEIDMDGKPIIYMREVTEDGA